MTPRHRLAASALATLTLAALAPGCKRADRSRTLALTGSSTVAPLAAELGKAFEADHPGVRVDVQTGGSSRGVADARGGTADIGMVSRPLHRDEQRDLRAVTIARDGVCLIASARLPLTGLTRAQVVAIYTGAVRNWRALGGPDRPITVVHKSAGHSTLELFLEHFELKAGQVKADVVIGDNEQGVKTVEGNPGAIGYVSIGTAAYDAAHGVGIKLLQLDGVAPSAETVAAGRYPFARPLNLVTRGAPGGLAAEFIAFARSAKARPVVERMRFVPLAR